MADSLFNMNPYFNLNALSGGITGIADFGPELAYHLANLRANESGGGAAGLAAGRAASDPALAYQRATAAPSGLGDEFGADSFARLMAGQTASRGVGRGVQSDVRNQSAAGIGDVSSRISSALAGRAESEIAQNQANASQQSGFLGELGNILGLGAGVVSEFFAPGNPFGTSAILGGAGGLLGGGSKSGGVTGAGTPFGGSPGASSSFGSGTGPFSLGFGPNAGGFAQPTVPPTGSGASFGWGLGPFSLMGS